MGAEARWNVKVSRTLDTDLRTFLAERGGKKGDLSNFIERAVAKALLQETLRDVHLRNQDLSEDDALALVESELASAREDHKDFWTARDWSAPYP